MNERPEAGEPEPVDDLETEVARRAREARRRWEETETALRARWDQREAALREAAGETPAARSLRNQARAELERARAAQLAHQEAIRRHLERLEALTAELERSGAVEPRQRIRERLAQWWRGIFRRRARE